MVVMGTCTHICTRTWVAHQMYTGSLTLMQYVTFGGQGKSCSYPPSSIGWPLNGTDLTSVLDQCAMKQAARRALTTWRLEVAGG